MKKEKKKKKKKKGKDKKGKKEKGEKTSLYFCDFLKFCHDFDGPENPLVSG